MKKIFVFLLLPCIFSCNTLGQVLSRYGYSETRPPSILLAPGTVIYLTKENVIQGGIICPCNTSLGDNVKYLKSPGNSFDLIRKTTGTFDLDAKYLKQINVNGKYDYVKSVKLTLSNVEVIELSDDEMLNNLNNRTDNCQTMIDKRRENKFQVTMIKSVLKADVIYNISLNQNLNIEASVKQNIIKNLEASLGLKVGTDSSTILIGNGLFWGAVDDTFMGGFDKQQSKSLPKVSRDLTKNYSILKEQIQIVK